MNSLKKINMFDKQFMEGLDFDGECERRMLIEANGGKLPKSLKKQIKEVAMSNIGKRKDGENAHKHSPMKLNRKMTLFTHV